MVESGKPNAAGWRLAGSLTTKASCLHQLQAMGEDAEEYAIIRNYTKGKTIGKYGNRTTPFRTLPSRQCPSAYAGKFSSAEKTVAHGVLLSQLEQ